MPYCMGNIFKWKILYQCGYDLEYGLVLIQFKRTLDRMIGMRFWERTTVLKLTFSHVERESTLCMIQKRKIHAKGQREDQMTATAHQVQQVCYTRGILLKNSLELIWCFLPPVVLLFPGRNRHWNLLLVDFDSDVTCLLILYVNGFIVKHILTSRVFSSNEPLCSVELKNCWNIIYCDLFYSDPVRFVGLIKYLI